MSISHHLKTGLTTLCRCWAVTRKDGRVFGFTDHDHDLEFEGLTFKADTGLTASALQQVTGLAVDNSEAVGALSDASVTEEDIAAGRFDDASITYWQVNWQNHEEREVQFSGSMGEIKRADGAFYAELRGASEALNKPLGRVYQKPCSAVLGDSKCKLDLSDPEFSAMVVVEQVENGRVFRFGSLAAYDARWFERGKFSLTSGDAAGLGGMIKNDLIVDGVRVIELWEEIKIAIAVGDQVTLTAGCDKRYLTCGSKFENLLNYRGFPHIPGEDWLMAYPSEGGANDGGSRYR
jgi:uncharacterized phage protein (TIGR02218 family)